MKSSKHTKAMAPAIMVKDFFSFFMLTGRDVVTAFMLPLFFRGAGLFERPLDEDLGVRRDVDEDATGVTGVVDASDLDAERILAGLLERVCIVAKELLLQRTNFEESFGVVASILSGDRGLHSSGRFWTDESTTERTGGCAREVQSSGKRGSSGESCATKKRWETQKKEIEKK